MSDVDKITEKLNKTTIPKEEGVSFAGKGLHWNNAEDAQEVVDRINECPNMEYLNLEGNTLGVEAAEAIAKALEKQSNMKKALWKDMFTGRMKDEIPLALKHLSRGLMKANAKLEVLDLSDNASGPIGAEGIVDLIRSPTCYSLKELKLNNMGLGITGATMLAEALKDCYDESKKAGNPLSLKVFIAGRNRLENEGSTALANVFEEMGSLEKIQVPQNGIYLPGISALSRAFAQNPNLKEINLNDNTLNPEGASAVSESITNLNQLVKLDLGDCLMKSEGALFLAKAFEEGLPNLEEVIVSFNSIKANEGLAIFEALSEKQSFRSLQIDGNNFGPEGVKSMKRAAESAGKEAALGSLSEDEGSDSDGSYDEEGSSDGEDYSGQSEEEEDEDEYNGKDNSENSDDDNGKDIESGFFFRPQTGSAKEFLQNPTEDNFNRLGDSAVPSIIQEVKRKDPTAQLDELMKAIILVSGLIDSKSNDTVTDSQTMSVCRDLYEVLFQWAEENNLLSYVNNILPVYLGLIKDEETKKPIKNSKLGGCRLAVTHLMKEEEFPENTRGILGALMKFNLPLS